MEAKSNKELITAIRIGRSSAGFNPHQYIYELADRLEAAEKTLRLLKAYVVYTETGTAHGEFSTTDAEAIEQIVKEGRGEK